MVLLVTWALGVFVLMRIGPVLSRTLVEFDVAGPWIVDWYDAAARHSTWVGPLLPLVFGAWLAWAWYRCGRLAEGQELHPLLAFGAVGILARLQRASRLSSMADLLSLLIANDVALSDAVELASAAVGSAELARGGQELARQLRRGEVIDQAPAGFPPVLAWTLASGQSQPRLMRTLSRTAEVYRDEVSRRSQWLMIYVPLFTTIGICGSLVCLYALVTLGPWIALMRRVSEPY